MAGPEGENNHHEMSSEAKLGRMQGIFEGLLIELNSEIKDTKALPSNIHVQGGRIRSRDRELAHLLKVKERIVATRNRIYTIFGIEIPVEEESPDLNS